MARVLMPPGTPLKRTEKVIAELEQSLAETNAIFRSRQPEDQDLVQTTFARFSQNTDAMETGPHVATLQADLLANEYRDGRIAEIVQTWRRENGEVPDALSITFDEPQLGPAGRNIEIQLAGPPLEELDRISAAIQQYLQSFGGVYNINDDLRRGESELLVKLKPGAVGMGVSTIDLARQLRGSFQGLLSDQIQVGPEEYDVEVRFAAEDRDSITDLEDYLVTLPHGKTIPINEIAEITYRRGWSRITRFNSRRVVTVFASVDSEVSNASAVLADLQSVKLPELTKADPDLVFTFKGEAEKGAETGSSMAMAAVDRLPGGVRHPLLSVSQLPGTGHRDGRHSICAGRRDPGALAVWDEPDATQLDGLRIAGRDRGQRFDSAGVVSEIGAVGGQVRSAGGCGGHEDAIPSGIDHVADDHCRTVATVNRAQPAGSDPDSHRDQHLLWADGIHHPGPARHPRVLRHPRRFWVDRKTGSARARRRVNSARCKIKERQLVNSHDGLDATLDQQAEADINQDGQVNLLDVHPFVKTLSGS